MTKWVTFDCYGTLIDWNEGIRSCLASLWPEADPALLLERYHEIEPRVQQGSSLPYRQVLAQGLRLLADGEGLALAAEDEAALADSLPSWRPFPEVPGALADLRGRGFNLVILSNTDPDLLAASLERIGVRVEGAITAAEAGSYKPAHGHWERFFERFQADPERHVHVGASVFHDLEPAAELGLRAVWINRLREVSDVSRAAELKDLSRLPEVADSLVPAEPLP
jgi:2-haloacid dehalogenase